jgi:hypothetical protein
LGDPGVDGTIILRWIFRKWDVGIELALAGFAIEERSLQLVTCEIS